MPKPPFASERWRRRASAVKRIGRRVWYDPDTGFEYFRDPDPAKGTWHEVDPPARSLSRDRRADGATGIGRREPVAPAPVTDARNGSAPIGGCDWPDLPAGTRVRLPGGSHVLRLRSRLGTVVGPAPTSPGHYLVQLDKPARYDNGVAPPRRLEQVVEAADNLTPISPSP